MPRGTHSLRLLYRRLQGLPDRQGRIYDERDLRDLAEFLFRYADECGGKGAPEAMTILGLLAIDARRAVFVRWLLHPGGADNRFLDANDRAVIDEFIAYADRVRAGEIAGLGTHGSISKERYLEQRGLEDVEGFAKRGFRFLGAARRDPRAPEILRTLPAFVPLGLDRSLESAPRGPLTPAAPAAIAAALTAAALFLWPRAPARTDHATADTAFAADLGTGPRVVLGWRDGRWRVARPDGTVEWEAPPALRLPDFVEGGAAGDLTGDGVPELVLFSSVPIEVFDQHQTGVWVFTREGTGWRLLDRLRDFGDGADAASCAALRDRLAVADELTLGDHRARQRCPSRIGGIAIHGGAIHVAQLHYGRQYLRATCDAARCDALTPIDAVDSDVTSLSFVEAAGGGGALALGTGCWTRFGGHAYGVVVRVAGAERFTWTGGRTAVRAIDGRRLAVLTGTPCEGTYEQALVASADAASEPVRQRVLAIAEVAADGRLRFVDEVGVSPCCGEANTVEVLRRDGAPRTLAIWLRSSDRADADGHIQLFDLARPLAGQQPRELPDVTARDARLAAIDVDGDARDELIISGHGRGTEVWTIGDTAVARRRW